ncbi:MAG: hypothetical protein M1837_006171 [Sclerophora amabilis]|nr:MAG: hypothetical protein M1837_006171 [Sclerophora amabilis]
MNESIKAVEKKSRTVFHLDSPFSTIEWPHISDEDQHMILELLCNLLEPIGRHRSHHPVPSKGKRARRRAVKDSGHTHMGDVANAKPNIPTFDVPPKPHVANKIIAGLNSTSRHLEELARTSTSSSSSTLVSQPVEDDQGPSDPDANTGVAPGDGDTSRLDNVLSNHREHLVAVFLPRSSQPSLLNSHFPLLVYLASQAVPSAPQTRLVSLPKGSEGRLSRALRLPRVGCIGLMEMAPEGEALIGAVRGCVPEIRVPWLEAKTSEYRPVNIKATQTTAPVLSKSQRRKREQDNSANDNGKPKKRK